MLGNRYARYLLHALADGNQRHRWYMCWYRVQLRVPVNLYSGRKTVIVAAVDDIVTGALESADMMMMMTESSIALTLTDATNAKQQGR